MTDGKLFYFSSILLVFEPSSKNISHSLTNLLHGAESFLRS